MTEREEARAAWADSGLTFDDLTDDDLQELHSTLDRHLRSSGVFEGSLRMAGNPPKSTAKSGSRSAKMLCDANYFDGREAVSFHGDGFVGFCGWASDVNAAPFVGAFREWLSGLTLNRRPS